MRVAQVFSSALMVVGLSIPAAAALKLNVTAIGARHGHSTLECWQLDHPFDVDHSPGTAGSVATSLGSVANISYNVIPASYDGGRHNAPHNQWVVFLSGLAYITLPTDNTTSAYVPGGEFGVIFAADTAACSKEGHQTQYPGITETATLQIPTQDGEVPAHDLIHMGPCAASEIGGFRGLSS